MYPSREITTLPRLSTLTSASTVTAQTSSSLPTSTSEAVLTAEVTETSPTSPDSPSGTSPTTDEGEGIDRGGREAVLAFLNALADKDYAQAASLYGDVLTAPGKDRAEQLAAAVRLLVVLPPRYVRTDWHGWLQEVWVQLVEPDGTPHVHTPPEDVPEKPSTEFPFYVVKVNGQWWVMSLPPYEE